MLESVNPDTDSSTPEGELPAVLRDLAWTVHRRVPDTAGITAELPSTELVVLKHLLDSPGITVMELSRRLGLRQSNTSAAVRTLAERGLLTREPSDTDRRVSRLLPTADALAEDAKISEAWSGAIRAAVAELDAEQRAALEAATAAIRALDRVMRAEQSSR